MPHWGTSSEFQRGEGRFKTRHYVILHVFLRHTFLLPVEIRNSCLTEARVCHHLKGYARRGLTEARVPSSNGEKGYIMT